jgi:CBS-domain-containing membrane protein
LRIFDDKLRPKIGKYLLQSLLATLVLVVAFNLMDFFSEVVIFAAMGATTFIVFAMPKYITASPRRVIGGHFVGIFSGSMCRLLLELPLLQQLLETQPFVITVVGAFSVGLTMLLMVSTQTEHPPAAGTALGLVVEEWSLPVIGFVILCAVLLSAVKYLLRRWLIDLV